jgi:DNA-binding transcriptional LysR family regulator
MRIIVRLRLTMSQLDDMRLFVATLDTGSFTAAADRLGRSKQIISRRVMALEEQLGARLLVRTTRHLRPTDLGLAYAEQARRILQQVEEIDQAITGAGQAARGRLRITAPMSFGTMHLSPLLAWFLEAYPQVAIELDLSDRTVDLLGEGYDLAIRIDELADSSMIALRVALLEQVTCASPAYIERRGDPDSIDALADAHEAVNYLSPATGRAHPLEFTTPQGVRNVTLSGPVAVNSADLYTASAIAGLGIVQVPRYRIRAQLANGELCVVLPACPPPPIPVSVVYPQNRQVSLRVRAFADWLAQVFEEAF